MIRKERIREDRLREARRVGALVQAYQALAGMEPSTPGYSAIKGMLAVNGVDVSNFK
jgi:hypothetical protein